ncbi:MAG: peptidyl-prolyl cis-trans isomerase [Micavibrio sp.]|nr:MAG: peptidyl-prolyl cis-trans isomerase [Micavibrio sp.]
MVAAPGITVNGVKITPEQINAEVQYYPAESLFSAKYEAMQALVVRELLIQRAAGLGLCDHDEAVKSPDDILEALFEKEIDVPQADKETCKRFYDNNRDRFFTSPLFEAAHILYPALPGDDAARTGALEKAQTALERITKKPEHFETIAKTESACSSAKLGGHLGQVTKGQTTPAFEAALLDMQEGDISSVPLASEFGYHVIKVHKRLEGKQLPFEAVQEWIADYLQRQSWQRAFSQYVQILAGEAEVSGFQLKQADTPLVQ